MKIDQDGSVTFHDDDFKELVPTEEEDELLLERFKESGAKIEIEGNTATITAAVMPAKIEEIINHNIGEQDNENQS